MSRLLKQSTAFTFRVGPFLDSTDGVTAETALSIAQADIQLSKAGGAFAQTSASPTTTHDTDGWYQCPLTATDTGTLGTLTVQIVMSGALPVWEHFMVVPANVYDSLVAGSDVLNADVTQWLGTAVATPTTAGVPEVDVTYVSGTAQTANDNGADINSILATVDHASYGNAQLVRSTTPANTLDVSAAGEAGIDWANVGSPTTSVTLSGTTVGTTTTNTDMRGTDGANTTTPPTAAAVADTVWDESAAAHVGAGSFGEEVQGHALSSEVAALNDIAATDIVSGGAITTSGGAVSVVSTLTGHTVQTGDNFARLGAPAGASVSADIAGVQTDTTAIVADTNELQGDWTDGGRLDVILDARAAQTTVDAIETDTQNIQGRLPAALIGGRMDSDLEAINNDTTAPDNIAASAVTMTTGSVTGTPSTTSIPTNLTEATDDHYVGQILAFRTGALAGQKTDITAYNGTTKTLTVTALTEAPAASDTFIIL